MGAMIALSRRLGGVGVANRLTGRQREILEHIRGETQRRGYPPSVREIGQAIGLSSSSTVHGHLDRLEEKGFIRRDPSKPRAIEVTGDHDLRQKRMVHVPLVGQVTAGTPILATENIEDTFSLPYELVGAEDAFLLRVRGDSMINAGISDGDFVIVRRQESAGNGDVVVALLEDEATVKRFFHGADHVRLQPENDTMEPIIARDVKILGKVVGLFRRM
jgi:repressor LexA